MRHKHTLDPAHTALAVIDMQEGFRSHISDFAETAARIALVTHAAQLLHVPVIVTEQYPKGLGRTVSEVAGKSENNSTETPGTPSTATSSRRMKVSVTCGNRDTTYPTLMTGR